MKSSSCKLSVGFVGFLDMEGYPGWRETHTIQRESTMFVCQRETDSYIDEKADKADKADIGPIIPVLELETRSGFCCQICTNGPTRCEWCAEHLNDLGVISCGDCERGRMKRASVSWSPSDSLSPYSKAQLIPVAIREKISAIEFEARRLGWLPEQLWNSSFWDLPRGLAALLDEDDEIAQVDADQIVILKVERRVLRFQRRIS